MAKFVINDTVKSEKEQRNFLDVGIHDNVELKNIEYNVSENGNKFIVFTFEKDGKQLAHTEWEPKADDEEQLISKTRNQAIRIKHILTKFIDDPINIDADDFESYAKAIIAATDNGNKYKGKLFRVKIILSRNGFTTLPRYVPFIESMDVPKEESKLEIYSIDKIHRDNQPTVNTNTDNPFESGETDADAKPPTKEDLPF